MAADAGGMEAASKALASVETVLVGGQVRASSSSSSSLLSLQVLEGP